jgi:myo-inositol-1(or 4)-monophosphatase
VSVAAEVDGQTVVGVVEVPRFGETFTAVLGRGAVRNGVPVHVSGCQELSQAMVATGFGYAAARRARQAAVLAEVLPRVRDIRRFGAASVDLCSVACGRVDGYYERGLKPWDLAAGGLVAREAGALVTGLAGAPAGEDLVLAANPALHPVLDALLTPLAPDRD